MVTRGGVASGVVKSTVHETLIRILVVKNSVILLGLLLVGWKCPYVICATAISPFRHSQFSISQVPHDHSLFHLCSICSVCLLLYFSLSWQGPCFMLGLGCWEKPWCSMCQAFHSPAGPLNRAFMFAKFLLEIVFQDSRCLYISLHNPKSLRADQDDPQAPNPHPAIILVHIRMLSVGLYALPLSPSSHFLHVLIIHFFCFKGHLGPLSFL